MFVFESSKFQLLKVIEIFSKNIVDQKVFLKGDWGQEMNKTRQFFLTSKKAKWQEKCLGKKSFQFFFPLSRIFTTLPKEMLSKENKSTELLHLCAWELSPPKKSLLMPLFVVCNLNQHDVFTKCEKIQKPLIFRVRMRRSGGRRRMGMVEEKRWWRCAGGGGGGQGPFSWTTVPLHSKTKK